MYRNYIEKISEKADHLFKGIEASHNFDYGLEFELALIELLQRVLPKKYSVCRGHIVTKDNYCSNADDIIIFNSDEVPTLRLEKTEHIKKHYIPLEAVYAYIEAKHTLDTEDLKTAYRKINEIKNLERQKIPFNFLNNRFRLNESFKVFPQENWPEYQNPIYCAIISRNCKFESVDKLKENVLFLSTAHQSPDLIIADKYICLPIIPGQKTENGIHKTVYSLESPFFIENKSLLICSDEEHSFGLGLGMLLYALSSIILGNIHYPSLLAKHLNA